MLSSIKALLIFASAFVSTSALAWSEVDSHMFNMFDSLDRCQGITNDQNGHVWFSANQKLSKTPSWTGSPNIGNGNPFSDDLKSQGANHIGDLDYAQGLLFAPIEDGPKYQHPFVGIYNASNLQLQRVISLPQSLQPDGVPWVTVDPSHQRLITATYSNTTKINTYDWQTGQQIEQIPMSTTLNSIQGGKFWKNHLYMTANDSAGGFAVYDMDLESGVVQKIIHLNKNITEIEGLTFVADAGGSVTDFYILGITGSGLNRRIVLYHWK